MTNGTYVTLTGERKTQSFRGLLIARNAFLGLTTVLIVAAAVAAKTSFGDQRYLSVQLLLLGLMFFCYYEYRAADQLLEEA